MSPDRSVPLWRRIFELSCALRGFGHMRGPRLAAVPALPGAERKRGPTSGRRNEPVETILVLAKKSPSRAVDPRQLKSGRRRRCPLLWGARHANGLGPVTAAVVVEFGGKANPPCARGQRTVGAARYRDRRRDRKLWRSTGAEMSQQQIWVPVRGTVGQEPYCNTP